MAKTVTVAVWIYKSLSRPSALHWTVLGQLDEEGAWEPESMDIPHRRQHFNNFKIKPGHILSSAKEQRDSHAICLENKNTVILHTAEITKVQKRAWNNECS